MYRGTSLIRNTPLLGLYNRTIPTVLWWFLKGDLFLVSEVTLFGPSTVLNPDTGQASEEA